MSQKDDTHCHDQSGACCCEGRLPQIGLALSGGGFRASIFHLGVIRRLEELGIMKYVHTISAVSGGSIIAAYYVIEMEKRLRQRRNELAAPKDPKERKDKLNHLDQIRLEIFEEIADCFFQALDHNLRSRALVFHPFYHPLLSIQSLWPSFSRSDIMQKEFDEWLYNDGTLDHLPASTLTHDQAPCKAKKNSFDLTGPAVVLNTTSLLTGERKGFTREPVSRLGELHRGNQNVLKLSRVVGASSGVPGVFPPTMILGDKFVDGGVADNQGIDALVSLDRFLDHFLDGQNGGGRTKSPTEAEDPKKGGPAGTQQHREQGSCKSSNACASTSCDEGSTDNGQVELSQDSEKSAPRGTSRYEGAVAVPEEFDVLLVSDASGQMEVKHRLGIQFVKVLPRIMSIFQFQLRRKIVRILRWWKKSASCRCDRRAENVGSETFQCREFAFVHLFLNLKGRCRDSRRVPSEYIPALGRIRTDLDQFSPIEREALMYHGYTLIDAQIEKYCHKLKKFICKKNWPPLTRPPLFREQAGSSQSSDQCTGEAQLRTRVQKVLTAGSGRMFLIRSWRKYPGKSWFVFGPALSILPDGFGGGMVKAILLCLPDYLFSGSVRNSLEQGIVQSFWEWVRPWISHGFECIFHVLPSGILKVWEVICAYCSFPAEHIQVLKSVSWIFLWIYFVLFLTHWAMRRMVRRWDLKDYYSLTGQEPTVHW